MLTINHKNMVTNGWYDNQIHFSHFCSLVDQLGRKKRIESKRNVLKLWIDNIKLVNKENGLPQGTVAIFFRLLFPEQGVRRRYGMQEQVLCEYLESYFKTRKGRFDGWNEVTMEQRSRSTGCLGLEVKRWMEHRFERTGIREGPKRIGELTLGQADKLLDQLASFCQFSAKEVLVLRPPNRTPRDILKDLFDHLPSLELSIMIQVILRDLGPSLNPLPSLSGVQASRNFTANAGDQIDVGDALKAWDGDGRWTRLWRVRWDLDEVAREVEKVGWEKRLSEWKPVIGTPVQIPKTERPGTCDRATRMLRGPVAVETKYDGERLQVHVDFELNHIQIFSKSGRDSTEDRRLLHPIIRASLSLAPLASDFLTTDIRLFQRLPSSSANSHVRKPRHTQLILEGEMVSYDEREERIDEYWTLAHAKTGNRDAPTSFVTGVGAGNSHSQDSVSTGHTLSPRAPASPWRGGGRTPQKNGGRDLHLMIVWFDVLLVDGVSLLDCPFENRRNILLTVITPIHGFSMLAEQVIIDFDRRKEALSALRDRFALVIATRGEGLMLKPLLSEYNDTSSGMRWIKLKKDFIPGAGDTKDFHIVGASWQKDRGRTLNVPPSVFTTFFVGVEAEHLGAHQFRTNKKHFHILFSTSYGLNRLQLDNLCGKVRQQHPEPFTLLDASAPRDTFGVCANPRSSLEVFESACTTFTFSLSPSLRARSLRPTFIFKKPMVFELTGAGFQKSTGSNFYELRWPRMTKVDRQDGDPVDLNELQRIAKAAMKFDIDPHDAEEHIARIWTTDLSCITYESPRTKFEKEKAEWRRRLEIADGMSVMEAFSNEWPSNPALFAPVVPPVSRFVSLPIIPSVNTQEAIPSSSTPTCSNLTSTAPNSEFPSTPIIARRSSSNNFLHADSFVTPPSQQLRPESSKEDSARQDALEDNTQTARYSRELAPSPCSPRQKRPHSFPDIVLISKRPMSANKLSRLPSNLSICQALLASPPDMAAPSPIVPMFWASYPPSLISPLPIPKMRSVELSAENHLTDARDVCWAAGLEVIGRNEAYLGTCRQGVIFLEDSGSLQCLKALIKGPGRQLVWVISKDGFDLGWIAMQKFLLDIL
ncbi:hypothetical protein T439DRAFT_381674 [Meredithblackwellia eburnea MCA 4105]